MGLTQMEAVSLGRRRRRSPYRAMIEAQTPYLPEMYRLKEKKAEAEKTYALQEKSLALSKEQAKQSEEATKMANLLGIASVGTQAYLGYKMGTPALYTGKGIAPSTSISPAAGAGAGIPVTPQASAVTTGGAWGGGPSTTGAGGGGGASALGYLFAAYVGYKLWQGEKKRGAKYPGQPLLQSMGKSLERGWKSFSRRF